MRRERCLWKSFSPSSHSLRQSVGGRYHSFQSWQSQNRTSFFQSLLTTNSNYSELLCIRFRERAGQMKLNDFLSSFDESTVCGQNKERVWGSDLRQRLLTHTRSGLWGMLRVINQFKNFQLDLLVILWIFCCCSLHTYIGLHEFD